MFKKPLFFLIIASMFFLPTYSQNIVNISLSAQEMQNGLVLFNQRKYTAAIQAFELALAYEPKNYAAQYRLGLAYLYAGYAQNATREWEELVKLGVADYQVIEKLNNLYFKMSMDESYDYEDPYIFRKYYDGFTDGGHDIFRSSFIIYDEKSDLTYISSVGKKQVVALDNANNIVSKYGTRLFLPSVLNMPMGLALYSNMLYVADYKKNQIFVFNRNNLGQLVTNFGTTGSLSNQLSGPMGLKISDDGYLYVVDNGNNRIQKFLPNGTHIYHFGSDFLYRPTDIIVKDDMIYISDIDKNSNGRLVIFDDNGNFVTNIGTEFLKEPRGLFLEDDEIYITDSTGYVYIYDTKKNTTRTFLDGTKSVSPFSMIKNKDKIVWRTDFNSEKISIYTPLQGVYGNLELDISQVLTDQYPYVYMLLRARNKDGSIVTGITKDELNITEFTLPVKDILVSGTTNHRNNMKLSIVVDRSLSAQKFTPQLEYYLKSFLSNTSQNDLINTILVDEGKYISSGESSSSISKTWNFITNYQSKAQIPQSWDISIYDAITQLLNNLRNRAIIIFTSGQTDSKSFDNYSIDVVKTYASQNNIPIYIVNFSDNNRKFWEQLATSTHGRYFNANQHANDILQLHSIIKNAPPLEYLVEYKGYNYNDVPNLWVDVNLKLERFGISGVTTDGYYVPKPVTSNNINLLQSFFPQKATNE